MKLSKQQIAMFWRMFAQAVHERGIARGQETQYRREILRETTGYEHLTEINPTDQFDRVMARVCEEAGDYASAIRYQGATVDRWRHVITERAREVLLMKGGLSDERGELLPGVVESYLTGIILQGRLVSTTLERDAFAARLAKADGWYDFDERALRLLLQIVCSERAKLVKGAA